MKKVNINTDWQLSANSLSCGKNELYRVKKNTDVMDVELPCDVHMALLKYGRISNPVVSDNYKDSLWIEEKSWWFSRKLVVDKDMLNAKKINLVFERLDIMADIFVNDTHIGEHKSVFFPFVKDIKEYLIDGENTVYVRVTAGLESVSRTDTENMTVSNFFNDKRFEPRRTVIRKPQYVFGWDWCPRIPTCGITGDAYLELVNDIRINSVHVSTVKISDKALIKVEIETDNTSISRTVNAEVRLDILFNGKKVKSAVKKEFIRSGTNYTDFLINIENPELWWPNGMGEQPIYTASVEIIYDKNEERYEQTFGVRTIDISTKQLNEKENEFVFVINGKKIFAKGGNWVPADSIYCSVTEDKLKKLVASAAELNFNFIRIWGGGVYESDVFYNLCDKYGILIWHDFMFACGMIPDRDEKFTELVKKELVYQIKRLRNHPSMALWCGSNENHQFYEIRRERDNLEYFGGEYVYNYIAPQTVHLYSPEIQYWNCSPYGGEHSKSNDAGDEHCWGTHFLSGNVEMALSLFEYDMDTAKFISEYGHLGPCCVKSITEYMGADEIDMKSPEFIEHINTMDNVKKAPSGLIEKGIEKYYGITAPSLEEYSLYGGMVQGMIYEYSIDAHRIMKFCGGNIIWMYNDCWGESGWTPIDYYLRKKPAYYSVKRAYSPLRMIIRNGKGGLALFIVNDCDDGTDMEIIYGYTSFDGRITETKALKTNVHHGINEVRLELSPEEFDLKSGVIYAAESEGKAEKAIYCSEKCKMSDIPCTTVTLKDYHKEHGEMFITVEALGYAHGVYFNDMEDLLVSDMFFDLLPGEEKTVSVKNYMGEKPVLNWINK